MGKDSGPRVVEGLDGKLYLAFASSVHAQEFLTDILQQADAYEADIDAVVLHHCGGFENGILISENAHD